jgi:hypothetical protein
MAQRKESSQANASTDLLKDLLIVALASSEVPQSEIRKIVGCDMNKVNRIAKHIRKGKVQ